MEDANFYPRTPCGVRQRFQEREKAEKRISIHVPRAGYDSAVLLCCSLSSAFLSTYPVRGTTLQQRPLWSAPVHFYPRTPCGVRQLKAAGCRWSQTFLSTYPVRGTTKEKVSACVSGRYFYPRTPCGVRHLLHKHIAILCHISIHVPRAGYDCTNPLSSRPP